MNEPLSAAKLAELTTTFPVKLTKHEKLLMLADLVEQPRRALYIHSNLEQWGPGHLADPANLAPSGMQTVFSLAADHAAFRADGLDNRSVGGVMKYLELNMSEVHQFSCDCGGHISNQDAASRIRKIAG